LLDNFAKLANNQMMSKFESLVKKMGAKRVSTDLGVDLATIYRWANMDRMPSAKSAKRIKEVYNLTLKDIRPDLF
jgi:hypothetical protein